MTAQTAIEQQNPPYFKSGENVTVEAGINGFIIHTEDGQLIAQNPNDLLGIVLAATTNHAAFVARQEAEKKAQAEHREQTANQHIETDDAA